MMRITIISVGKLKERHWRDAADEYLKRLRPYATMDIVEITDRDVTRDERRALDAEADDICAAIPDGTHVVLMDVEGNARSSETFAAHLSDLGVDGISHLAFIIGGASGVEERVRARARERMSFGPMTLPHQMARVVLLEQIYRAFKIARGEPYHR